MYRHEMIMFVLAKQTASNTNILYTRQTFKPTKIVCVVAGGKIPSNRRNYVWREYPVHFCDRCTLSIIRRNQAGRIVMHHFECPEIYLRPGWFQFGMPLFLESSRVVWSGIWEEECESGIRKRQRFLQREVVKPY